MELPSLFDLHPDEDLMERYVMRQLGQADTDVIEAHLLLCEPCRRLCTETEDHIKLIRKILGSSE